MKDIRNNTFQCGYCGTLSSDKTQKFCIKCLGDENLKFTQLSLLLRMQAISDKRHRNPLTPEEQAELLPQYQEAQIRDTAKRGVELLRKRTEEVEQKYEESTSDALIERDGHLWLIEHEITQIPRFYKATGVFTFGWMTAIDPAVVPALAQALEDFPFNFEIK